ncbi:uncharacterized protein N7482_007465 [Penicillium canariense]|uniref:Uncharacterized protein n=1 Tax=Penicillium canariense TaxID=189055 RepID=A0A9W9HZH8_9EURO|nr:uncharacterized protein N7482_007465 [Penicillium canariense]KAJ5160461.1 hypothetical protein N7482_007465 [Penicillium canariense]
MTLTEDINIRSYSDDVIAPCTHSFYFTPTRTVGNLHKPPVKNRMYTPASPRVPDEGVRTQVKYRGRGICNTSLPLNPYQQSKIAPATIQLRGVYCMPASLSCPAVLLAAWRQTLPPKPQPIPIIPVVLMCDRKNVQ